jgi:hypothetical protein
MSILYDDIRNWREELILTRPHKASVKCPDCGTLNDSTDVVCMRDSYTLTGQALSSTSRTIIINILRTLAVAVALAAGYLKWLWPAYIYADLLIGTFFALFLRCHRTALRYFLFVICVDSIMYLIWQSADPAANIFFEGLLIISAVLLLLEPIFFIDYTLHLGPQSREILLKRYSMDANEGSLTWIALMLTASGLCFLILVLSQISNEFLIDGGFQNIICSLGITAIGGAETCALVASTIYTLRGEPFWVSNRWLPQQLHGRIFKRVGTRSRSITTWQDNLVYTVDRIIVKLTNGMINAVEDIDIQKKNVSVLAS